MKVITCESITREIQNWESETSYERICLTDSQNGDMGKVNEAELKWDTVELDSFGWREKGLADAVDSESLGCSLYELPPGKRSWPYHYHSANEEALFVLEGTGSLRLADEIEHIEAGDYVRFPADERGAHQLVNDSERPLRYLMISTRVTPDVTVYPDSEKIGVLTIPPPDTSNQQPFSGFYNLDDSVGYWEGEADE